MGVIPAMPCLQAVSRKMALSNSTSKTALLAVAS
jgi:hypothetical protein